MADEALKRGTLFAIGGREARSGEIVVLERFAALCGGPTARLLLVSSASDKPAKKADEYDRAFRSLGVEELAFFHPATREEAADPELLDALEHADGVLFPGGSQLKLVSTLGGTPFDARLRERHASGLPVGGTSAGAAVLGTVMISGGKGGAAPRRAAVQMAPGLGLVPGVIVDQHFRERDRIGRLLAAVQCNPSLLGLGLDEDTAFALDADGRLSVHGGGALTIVDGAELETTAIAAVPADAAAAFVGMRLHVLTDGWSYDLGKRRPGPAPVVAAD